jgi:hypothetical protein
VCLAVMRGEERNHLHLYDNRQCGNNMYCAPTCIGTKWHLVALVSTGRIGALFRKAASISSGMYWWKGHWLLFVRVGSIIQETSIRKMRALACVKRSMLIISLDSKKAAQLSPCRKT